MANKKNSVLLDVDPSILNNNLLINNDNIEDGGVQKFLNNMNWDGDLLGDSNSVHSQPGKLVQPEPGFCIKCWKENGDKLFINLCHTEFIPQPEDISDNDLQKLMLECYENSGNEEIDLADPKYRIPLSIGKLHTESDKGGRPCDVCDVAINSNFFNEKVLKSNYAKMFVMTVAVEGVASKYNINFTQNTDPIVLKHCKVMGKIEKQMVQIRNAKNNRTNCTTGKRLIEELTTDNKSLIGTGIKNTASQVKCTYQILVDPESADVKNLKPKYLTVDAFIEQPVLTSSKGLILDVGEDRLLLRTSSSSVLPLSLNDKIILDVFLPYNVVQDSCYAHFNTDNKVLRVVMLVAN